MDCKEYEKLIPDYIEQRMDFQELKVFDEHTRSCQSCREELEIQFLVSAGMARLEEGDSFDLQRELKDRMDTAVRELHFHERMLKFGFSLEILIAAAILVAVIWMVL